MFAISENWQSLNNPLSSVQALLRDGKLSGGFSLQSCCDHLGLLVMKPLPGQTCSSHLWSFLCNPRSKVPGRREWILRSNKHTFSDGRNWTHFSLSYSCRLAHSLLLKDIPRHDSEDIIPSAEHAERSAPIPRSMSAFSYGSRTRNPSEFEKNKNDRYRKELYGSEERYNQDSNT